MLDVRAGHVWPSTKADHNIAGISEQNYTPFLLLVNYLKNKLILRKDWDGVGMLDLDLGTCANGMYTVTLASNAGKAVRKLVMSK